MRLPTGGGVITDSIVVNMTRDLPVSTGGTGLINGFIPSDDASLCLEYNSYAANYSEVRVLGFNVRWLPQSNNAYDATHSPLVGGAAVDKTSGISSPANVATVLRYSSWKEFNSGKPLTIDWRMSSIEEATFGPTSAALVRHGGIIYCIANGAVSSFYGRFAITFVVEFRNRK